MKEALYTNEPLVIPEYLRRLWRITGDERERDGDRKRLKGQTGDVVTAARHRIPGIECRWVTTTVLVHCSVLVLQRRITRGHCSTHVLVSLAQNYTWTLQYSRSSVAGSLLLYSYIVVYSYYSAELHVDTVVLTLVSLGHYYCTRTL
ncbi:hypothetical protein J6590_004958 [Homalodisca vitripennis]|nr:hypothetical protein J6590_004958 [Homalodisca vitripennis]